MAIEPAKKRQRGAPQKPRSELARNRHHAWLNDADSEKYDRLGGVNWLRKAIREAKENA